MSFKLDCGDDVPLPCALEFFEPGWIVQRVRRLPEDVSAMVVAKTDSSGHTDVYVGTSTVGGVYRFNTEMPAEIVTTVATGLGDWIRPRGTCAVNCLAVRDIDHDGTPELVAETCQILPRGRPRLYVWSLGNPIVPRGVARPDIASSWSHGLGFVQASDSSTESILSTFCGYGEIVEYQLAPETSRGGFQSESIGWRQVGKLPASGEGTQTADIDNDGAVDVCIATGFAPGKAAIHVYCPGERGIESQPKHVVDEDGRFGNVRFLVTATASDGTQELIAWWCTGLADGECEIVRYRLGPTGTIEREPIGKGDAAWLWPTDGQVTSVDMDRDGSDEVWFATGAGNLWRYEPNRSSAIRKVCRVEYGIGPICGVDARSGKLPSLQVASRQFVLQLQRKE